MVFGVRVQSDYGPSKGLVGIFQTKSIPPSLRGYSGIVMRLRKSRPGGGFSHWHGIRICACLLGHLFAKFGIAIGGFSSETKEPKLHKLGVFWANYCKKHPLWSKLGAFLSKMVYWWVENLAKNWYRDSQIFEVRQAHPRTILVKEPPPPGKSRSHKRNGKSFVPTHE